ncbi:MAG: hypothetical protein LQ346_003559 [Caloplaca aetnensis]|nr:MAG: hypothetical protein LQ346_003559 [Caloplaca aetnensis]
MHYLTFMGAALALAAGASAGSFALVQKNNDIRAGCDLKIENVCGCSVTLSVHQTLMCDKLPKVWTHGKACGGKWQLNAQNPKHTVQLQTRDCHWGCNLPTLSALDPDDPLSKQSPGAKCDALEMGVFGLNIGGAKDKGAFKPKPKKGGPKKFGH